MLLALCELSKTDRRGDLAPKLASSLWSSIDAHGRVATHRLAADGSDAYQDYFPGQVMLALAGAYPGGFGSLDEDKLERAFRYYRHRFLFKRDFGSILSVI